jgi:hypothetical protein
MINLMPCRRVAMFLGAYLKYNTLKQGGIFAWNLGTRNSQEIIAETPNSNFY